MRTTAALSIFFCLLSVRLAAGQNFAVSCLEGQAQLRVGTIWTELPIGNALDSSIRLSTNAFVQIKGAGIEFTGGRPGTCTVRNEVAARRALFSSEVRVALGESLRHPILGPIRAQGTATGAKGANEEWMESSAQVFLAAGKEYLKLGKYDRAIEQFTETLKSATHEESPKIGYYLELVGLFLVPVGPIGTAAPDRRLSGW